MARAPCTFRQTDVTRAIRAVEAAGKRPKKVKVDLKSGNIDIEIAQDGDAAKGESERNEWDAEYGPDQPEVRKRLR